MRVLRVELGDGDQVDLHPSVSVVAGLSERQRTTLRRALMAIGSGLDPGVAALLEAHGVLLDATQADLDLLDVALDPATSVATPAELPGALAEDDADRLRTAVRDVSLLATDRRRAHDALRRAEAVGAEPTRAQRRARAESLRARIARHEARRTEPVRSALDQARDDQRAGAPPRVGTLVGALRDAGIDVEDLGLQPAEVIRIAQDWLEECRSEAAWAVGAGVELRGIEHSLEGAEAPAEAARPDMGALQARADRAVGAHAEAIERLDDLRTALDGRSHLRPSAAELEHHLLARLAEHRPARLAGAAPLLLDGLLEHLDDEEVPALLTRISSLAGGVQLTVVDPHPAAATWAGSVGVRRAARIEPVPERPAVAPT